MSDNRTPFGLPLEMPDPAPPRWSAIYRPEDPCTTHEVRYQGRMPCTGPLICGMCLTLWEPETGRLIEVRYPGNDGRPVIVRHGRREA